MKKHAFTLAEVLITIGIIGIVAALTIPIVTTNAFQRSNIVKLQATYKALNDAIKNMMIEERQTSVQDTVFAEDMSEFYTYLNVSAACDAATDCFASSYKSLKGSSISTIKANEPAATLPSGAAVQAIYDENKNNGTYGIIYVDVNGKENPNILGRDMFDFVVYDNGLVAGYDYGSNSEKYCFAGNNTGACVNLLETNQWVMYY